ncbi:MAG: hypothetical protein D6748_02045 [Calditrichaeota bacterium]|nr:MAG: hypothetical protein D6748_02045 [Calditrichota bacterium]
MFLTLLFVTFLISITVCFIIIKIFDKSLSGIMNRLIEESISNAWVRYLKFAIYVVGISSGVRIWQLEKYITPPNTNQSQIVSLTLERWVLEVYRTIIGTLQGVAWLLLVFFIFALLAYVIVRLVEFKKARKENP